MDGAIRYRVTIKAVVKRTKKVGKDWVIVGQKEGSNGKPEPVYGYTPEIDKDIEEEVLIIDQSLDRMDMREVVAVINGIPIDRTQSRQP